MNDEVERIRKEAVVAWSSYYLPGGAEEKKEIFQSS
jgi:hypothetical protein